MYDRSIKPIPEAPSSVGLNGRIYALIGITGYKMSKYRPSWAASVWSPLNVIWRPQLLSILIFEVRCLMYLRRNTQSTLQAALFGFGIGINVGHS